MCEIITFEHKFYFKKNKLFFKFFPLGGDFVKKIVLRVEFLNEELGCLGGCLPAKVILALRNLNSYVWTNVIA